MSVVSVSAVDWSVFGVCVSVPVVLTLLLLDRDPSTSQFLLADRSLSPLPVSVSLAVSYLSAVTIAGSGNW